MRRDAKADQPRPVIRFGSPPATVSPAERGAGFLLATSPEIAVPRQNRGSAKRGFRP
jgi:hypothetical protein